MYNSHFVKCKPNHVVLIDIFVPWLLTTTDVFYWCGGQGARALIVALEASRAEILSLRQALTVARQSSDYYRSQCEKLSRNTHEEVSRFDVHRQNRRWGR